MDHRACQDSISPFLPFFLYILRCDFRISFKTWTVQETCSRSPRSFSCSNWYIFVSLQNCAIITSKLDSSVLERVSGPLPSALERLITFHELFTPSLTPVTPALITSGSSSTLSDLFILSLWDSTHDLQSWERVRQMLSER